jgi:hypothetical protein
MPIRFVATNAAPFEDRVRWIPAYNDSGEVIPSCALCRVTSAVDGALHVSKPNSDGQDCVVNSEFSIPIGGWGRVTRETPIRILVNQEEGSTPTNGQEWGAKSGEWELYSTEEGFLISGGYSTSEQTVMAIRKTGDEVCVVPVAIRIDGGNETDGYEWTAMQQVEGSAADWEAIAGWNDTDLGFLAYEANGETVAAGAFIYPGQVDFCRQKAFFFFGNGVGGSRIILEFLEDSSSFGDLYLARITTELVDSFGNVSWTTGATVYAFPINQTLTPTLETLYFAYRTEEEEIVGGLPVYEVDRCCDAEGNQSSSGSVTTCECADLSLTTASIYGVGDVALTFSGGGWNADFEVTGEDWNISVTCIDHYFGIGQRGVIVGLYRVSDGAGFDSSIKGCDEALSWLAEEFDPPASGLDVSLS